MCGIIGAVTNRTDVIKEIFKQSQIRGKHATGISYLKDGIQTLTSSSPAKTFVKNINLPDDFIGIGHVRYSTSDLEFNQPIVNKYSIVHNGVITQEDPEKWERDFGYCDFETRNDSEILLKCIEQGDDMFSKFDTASIAMCYLKDETLFFGRNGSRPLWYSINEEGVFIASTKNILERAFSEMDINGNICSCEPRTLYSVDKSRNVQMKSEMEGSVDKQYPSISVKNKWYPKVNQSEEIQGLDKDFRNPENREQYLEEYFWWSLKTYDADPSLYMMNYVFERMELNSEQRYWICWLYGVTYNLPTAWIIANEFPDFENVDLDRLRNWELENKHRLKYQTDTKFNKGFLSVMFESYRDAIGDKTQEQWFQEQLTDNSYENFNTLFDSVSDSFNRFGRYMSWFYLQTLKETCGLNVDTSSLLLEMQSAHTQRQAIAYAVGDDEIAEMKLKKEKLNPEKVKFYSTWSEAFLENFKKKYPELRADHFVFETTLCAWKKTFRSSRSRYLGYYLDRQYEDIRKAQLQNWDGIDWDLLYQCRDEILLESTNRETGVVKSEETVFFNTGRICNFERIFENTNVMDEWI